MLCEKCKNKTATVHYRYNENGNITEIHMCTDCAKEEGLIQNTGDVSSGFLYGSDGIDNYFTGSSFNSFFGNPLFIKGTYIKNKVCPSCGMSENEFQSKGKFGCSECYTTFSDVVETMLNKMHMSSQYMGKRPSVKSEKINLKVKIQNLREDMQKAVEKQEYEEAARIRDAIKKLENNFDSVDRGDNA